MKFIISIVLYKKQTKMDIIQIEKKYENLLNEVEIIDHCKLLILSLD